MAYQQLYRLLVPAVARLCALTGTVFAIASCGGPAALEDLSANPDYVAVVGSRYKIVGAVIINGVIDLEQSDNIIDWYSFFPSPGIIGTEVVSSADLPKGTEFAVKRILRRRTLFGRVLLLEVRLDGIALNPPAPTYIGVYGGNEGSGLLLNEKLYSKNN